MCIGLLVQPYKSHNEHKYPTMHHFVTETCAYFCYKTGCIVVYLSNALWDLCDRPKRP